MTASARHFLQRGFIPVSEQVAHYEDEKTAKIGLVGCFGWDVGAGGNGAFLLRSV
jgi:hypothetical protein